MTPPTIAQIADPLFFREHRLDAHSSHRWYASAAEAESGTSSYFTPLDGDWSFHYAERPAAAPQGFEQPGFDRSGWASIPVPAHIQLEGYDRPQYCNVQYPWDGLEAVEPGAIPELFNPVASYARTFTPPPLGAGERLHVVFHGAESNLIVWVNGQYAGYAEDSFTPSEFDITDLLVPGENLLACQVWKFSSGSWIEDQDMYRFSGLFRPVELRRLPAAHAEDVAVTWDLAPDFSAADIHVAVKLAGAVAQVGGRLGDGGRDLGSAQAEGGAFTLHVDQPHLWCPDDPFLYRLTLTVEGADGVTEVIPLNVGLRTAAIEDGVFKLNGRRVVFHGVNRHDFGLRGRVMTPERVEADLKAMKRANINAVRTCHYPNNTFLYDLCDRLGLMVIDEVNLESHGFWDRVERGLIGVDEALPGNRPEWAPVLLDRTASLYERDKNHASVVIWSCGNESYGGTDILAMHDFFHAHDPSRPVQYEGVAWDPRYPATTDFYSEMYTPAAQIEEFLKTNRAKPFILQEYAHAMNNSFGAVDEYLDLAEREPLFQGGFIWDFSDQAILLTDRHGEDFFGYGGDCGEAPHDYEFSGNGIFFADHSETPKLQEVRYLYRDLRVAIGESDFAVDNRYYATRSSAFDCLLTLARDGVEVASAVVATDVAPGAVGSYPVPFPLPEAPGEYALNVTFKLPAATAWAEAGHEVSWEQKVWTVAGKPALARPAPRVVDATHNVGVHSPRASALFSRIWGGLTSYQVDGREVFKSVPQPCFWHAPTSNERGWSAPFYDAQWLPASRYARPDAGRRGNPLTVAERDGVAEVSYRLLLPTAPESACELAYRCFGDGRVEVTATLQPGAGLGDPPEFGLLFQADADLTRWRWYGEGPEECYWDRRNGARLGIYETEVAGALTPYLRPQEAGNRTGVRWAEVTDETGWGLRFEADEPMEFSALPWSPFEAENARHPNELPPSNATWLRPAWRRRGVAGDNSWGARTHPQYLLPAGEQLVFRFSFQPA